MNPTDWSGRNFFTVALLAAAASIAVEHTSEAALCTLDISYDKTYTANVFDGTKTHYAYITPLTAKVTSGTPPTGHPTTFETYCLDIGNTLASGQTWKSGSFPNPNSYPGNPIWTVDGIYKAAWLYQQHVGESGVKPGAALQLAIWEVLYERPLQNNSFSYDILNGSLKVTSGNSAFNSHGVAALANQYLFGLSQNYDPSIKITGTYWDAQDAPNARSHNQDLIGPAPVPEPATYVAGALLLVPFLTSTLFRRHKRQ